MAALSFERDDGGPPRAEFMVPKADAAQDAGPSSPLYQGIRLIDVSGGMEENFANPFVMKNTEFRRALAGTLAEQNFLSTDANAPFRLKAHIVQMTQGITVTVRYTLTRSKDGALVMDDVLQGTKNPAVVPRELGQALLPAGLTPSPVIIAGMHAADVNPVRDAEEAAMRANLSALIARLNSIVVVP